MDICVVGLGKIGLPVAVQAAGSGCRVRGADISPEVVRKVNLGQEPFPGELDLAPRLCKVLDDGLLSATTDTVEAVAASEAVIIVVPLIVDESANPDFGALDDATRSVATGLKPGALVSYETTLPVHTTRQRFTPRLAEISGLSPGQNLFVVHSPERVYSGRVFADLRQYPKLVGGLDPASTRRGVELYEAILDFDERPALPFANGVWEMESAEAAELAKLAETTYRNVNIGLANEFAVFAEHNGIDLQGVIEASNSQPFSAIHQPGISVGGHCIPVYPKFYLANDPTATLPAASIAVNEAMPSHAIDVVVEHTGGIAGDRIVVLGAAYRGGVRELAFSGVGPLVAEITSRGATALVHDPMFTHDELRDCGYQTYELGQPCDIAVLQADHKEYLSLSPADLPGVRLVYDGRSFLSDDRWRETTLIRIGRGT